jgi:hypothetical protein
LLAGGDNALAQELGLGSPLRAFGRRQKKGAGGLPPKLTDQDAKTAWGIAEAAGGFLGGEFIDKEGAQGFVLAVGGVGRLEKSLGRVRYVFVFIGKHVATVSDRHAPVNQKLPYAVAEAAATTAYRLCQPVRKARLAANAPLEMVL